MIVQIEKHWTTRVSCPMVFLSCVIWCFRKHSGVLIS